MMLLYSAALGVALAAGSPFWLWRMMRHKHYRHGLPERLGRVPLRLRAVLGHAPVLWVHAVSVGEVAAATHLVHRLSHELPDHRIVVSTTTPTGQQVARERFGSSRVFFYPLDFASAVRAYLDALQPRMLILLESELWPRMLSECQQRAIPVVVVNARVSDRSWPRYLRLRRLWIPLLQTLALLLAQSEEDARRWRAIGGSQCRVSVSGNLKYDAPLPSGSPAALLLRDHLVSGARVFVCGSTHSGEETQLLRCWAMLAPGPPRCMILAPRHPERCDAVAAEIESSGVPFVRLSRWMSAPHTLPANSVVLVDSVGELASLYSLAHLAFVGGSLVSAGGHNPLEPAQLGVPVLMGPHFQNFREIVLAMLQADAIRIVTASEMGTFVCNLLTANDDAAAEMGRRARAFAEAQRGATQRTLDAVLKILAIQSPAPVGSR